MTLENLFQSWAVGPGKTEQDKCDNAVIAIKKSISQHPKLSSMDVSVFPQGSYRARTNIAQDSDVDVCVCLNTTFFPRYPDGMTKEDFGNIDGSISYSEFKNLVHEALINYFKNPNVKRGDKAFDIHENTYRVDADTVAALKYKYYTGDKDVKGEHIFYEGVAFDTDKKNRIINWPEQTYENGVRKNDETNRKYKRMVRLMKNLRNDMQANGIAEANNTASFLIECLIWNVPNQYFTHSNYTDTLKEVLKYIYSATESADGCNKWLEVNGIKYLFHATQPWTFENVNKFILAAWRYVRF